MARGEVNQLMMYYKGASEVFVVFIDDPKAAQDWKTDKTIPLAQAVSTFKVFTTKQGTQGIFDGASNQTLENEFGTSDEEAVIKQIIEKGTLESQQFPERTGSRNDTMGARAAH